MLTRLIHVRYVNGGIAGCCYYLDNELQQRWGGVVCLREKTDISPRKGKVGIMHFFFDILFESRSERNM